MIPRTSPRPVRGPLSAWEYARSTEPADIEILQFFELAPGTRFRFPGGTTVYSKEWDRRARTPMGSCCSFHAGTAVVIVDETDEG